MSRKQTRSAMIPIERDRLFRAMTEGWLRGPALSLFLFLRGKAFDRGELQGHAEASWRDLSVGSSYGMAQTVSGMGVLRAHDWVRPVSALKRSAGRTWWIIPDMFIWDDFDRLNRSAGRTYKPSNPVPPVEQTVPPVEQTVPPVEQNVPPVEQDLVLIARNEPESNKIEQESNKKYQATDKRSRMVAPEVQELFDYYLRKLGKTESYVLDRKREGHLKARLAEHDAVYIRQAIDNLAASDFHREQGYTGIEYAIRSREQLEKIHDRKNGGNGHGPAATQPPPIIRKRDGPCTCAVPVTGMDPYTIHGYCSACKGKVAHERTAA